MFDIQEVKKNVVKWTSTRDEEQQNTANNSATHPVAKKSTHMPSQTAAVIGPSIHIEGQLTGEEALIIEGKVEGTIDLKNNNLTIGVNGKIQADVYANTIRVEGQLKGDIHGKERIHISKTGKVTGNIFAPRVSIEDGAHFRGSIDMDGSKQNPMQNQPQNPPQNQVPNKQPGQDGLKRA